ncbi:hypothetical protein [Streptomyces sp. HB132]|uniref:hypothetical protein n=1 Tax=Streptomyces sp. HB132 TaxID=767388 RepID=UPI00195FFCA9|nr:hypothetical protein [Streptomyces sp. HB132]
MGDVVAGLRVAAIASLTPLEELDGDPFLVDTRGQHAMCARWAADRGHVVTRQLRVHGLRHDHRIFWADTEGGRVDLFLAPNHRVLARALDSAADFATECERRGVRLEFAGPEEPAYTARTKADVHRRLSMPTAGYDGC